LKNKEIPPLDFTKLQENMEFEAKEIAFNTTQMVRICGIFNIYNRFI